MTKNKFKTTGTGFKTFTCEETGETVSRRKSFAINHKGTGKVLGKTANGREITCAPACKRIHRGLMAYALVTTETISKLG